MRSSTIRSRGFTLLEAMLAVAILGFGLALLVRSVAGSLGAAARARDASKALALAQAKSAELAGLGLLPERELEKWEEGGWLEGDFAPYDPAFAFHAWREPVPLDGSLFEGEAGEVASTFDKEAVYLEAVTISVGKVGDDGVERELVRLTTYARPVEPVAAPEEGAGGAGESEGGVRRSVDAK